VKRSRLWSAKSLILLLVLAAFSCGRPGSHYSASVYRLPWPGADGAVSLQDVEVSTLSDPEHFSGSAAHILVEPGDGGSTLAGAQPRGRLVRTSADVLVPADYVTMQAVTAYAHTERLRSLDASVGADGVLGYPLSLGVEVHVMSYGQPSSNNAVYDSKLDSLLLVPYTESGLPLSLNPGVLAHEHFHFLFQRLVLSHVHDAASQTSCNGAAPPQVAATNPESGKVAATFPDSEDLVEKTARGIPARTYNAYVLRGLNEGFADFYGWVYSADDSFLAKSLPEQEEMRRLDSPPGRLPSENLIRRLLVDYFHPEAILPDVVRAHNAYALGSIYARYLRHLVDDLVSSGSTLAEARLLVTRAVIAALPEIGAQLDGTYESGFLSPNFALSRILTHLPPLTRPVCESLEGVHAADSGYARPQACDTFSPPEVPVLDSEPAFHGSAARSKKDPRLMKPSAPAVAKPTPTPTPASASGGLR